MQGWSLDTIRGMLMGGAVGDALGAPHEFMSQRSVPYTGLLTERTKVRTRWQGTFTLALGQITDDTEMTLIIARSLVANRGYNRDYVLKEYMQWAGEMKLLGRNTRELFKGVKTIKGYETRYKKQFSKPMSEWTQSNGALMRVSPLALLFDNQPVLTDTSLTNPHPVTLDINLVYTQGLRLAAAGIDRQTIFLMMQQMAQTPEVQAVFQQILERKPRDLTEKKGWALHGFYCTLVTLLGFTTFQDAMDWVIQQSGDTDTNAHIAGAFLGTVMGYEALDKEDRTHYNIQVVRNCQTQNGDLPRPVEYTLVDFDALCQQLFALN